MNCKRIEKPIEEMLLFRNSAWFKRIIIKDNHQLRKKILFNIGEDKKLRFTNAKYVSTKFKANGTKTIFFVSSAGKYWPTSISELIQAVPDSCNMINM